MTDLDKLIEEPEIKHVCATCGREATMQAGFMCLHFTCKQCHKSQTIDLR